MPNEEDINEWVPGEGDHDEPELARIGRLLLAHEIDREITELRAIGHEIVHKAFDGEDITAEDIERLENGIKNLQWALEDHAKPVVEDESTGADGETVRATVRERLQDVAEVVDEAEESDDGTATEIVREELSLFERTILDDDS